MSFIAALILFAAPAHARVVGGVVPHDSNALDLIKIFYRELEGTGARRVWLLAPDHYRRVRSPAAVCTSDWPSVRADSAASELASSDLFESRTEVFRADHSVALHIPLIARNLPSASVVPIMLRRDISDIDLLRIKAMIEKKFLGDGDVILLSMDLSHDASQEVRDAEDARSIEALASMGVMRVRRADVDARRAAALALLLMRGAGASRGELIGRRPGPGSSCAAMIFRAP